MRWVLALSLIASVTFASEIRLPKKMVCGKNKDVIYTRIEGLTDRSEIPSADHALVVFGEGSTPQTKPKRDELAWQWRGDYYSATIDQDHFSYNLWTCDTEDRFYTFSTEDLVESADVKVKSKPVTGKLVISVREDEEQSSIECLAKY